MRKLMQHHGIPLGRRQARGEIDNAVDVRAELGSGPVRARIAHKPGLG
jgi:hypothetical protein